MRVDLRHQERPGTIAVAQRFPHPDLARAVVVIPAVVEEVHPLSSAGEQCEWLPLRLAQMKTTNADRKRSPCGQLAIRNFLDSARSVFVMKGHYTGATDSAQKLTTTGRL
jgi:hypothetical protein